MELVLGYGGVIVIWALGFLALSFYSRRNERLRNNPRLMTACFVGWIVVELPLLLLATPATTSAIKGMATNWFFYAFLPLTLGVFIAHRIRG